MLTVITGPPCAGKSTHVRQHAKPGDVVVDFDLIAQAVGSPVSHGHDSQVAEVAAAAWSGAIREAIRQHKARHRVWIVDSRPCGWRADQYSQAGARFVHLAAEASELHRRADADGRPAAWHVRIDEFLAVGDPEPKPPTRW